MDGVFGFRACTLPETHGQAHVLGALRGIARGSFFTAPLLLNLSADAVMNIEVFVINQSIGSRV